MQSIEWQSISDLATDRLLMAISTGELGPGTRIVEADIAARLGVSRVPVRESIRTLALQGILSKTGGRGLCVAPFDDWHVREIYELRVDLETRMLGQALPRFREPAIAETLQRCLGRLERAAVENNVLEMNQGDLGFHRTALAVSEHRLGQKMWEGISRHVQIVFGMELYRDPDFDAVVEQHRRLLAVLQRGDRDELAGALNEHICGYRALKLAERRSADRTTSHDDDSTLPPHLGAAAPHNPPSIAPRDVAARAASRRRSGDGQDRKKR